MENKIVIKKYNNQDKYSYYYNRLAFHKASSIKQFRKWYENFIKFYCLTRKSKNKDKDALVYEAINVAIKLMSVNFYSGYGFYFVATVNNQSMIIRF